MTKSAAALIALIMLAVPVTASADDAPRAIDQAYDALRDTAQQARASADAALREPSADAGTTSLTDVTAHFASVAYEASAVLRRDEGPADLTCIFAGMAEDAAATLDQLQAAETAALRAQAVQRLHALFDDAAVITPQGRHDEAGPAGPASEISCPAVTTNLSGLDQLYFTVQP